MDVVLASPAVFGLVIHVAMAAVALSVVVLAVLIVRDWRSGKLW